MKIAVIGLYYASNLGDAVICDCVMKWLRDQYPQAEIHLIDIEGKDSFSKQTTMPIFEMRIRQIKSKIEYWLTQHQIKDMMYFWNKKDVDSRQDFYDKIAGSRYDLAVFAGGQMFMDWLALDVSEFVRRFEKIGTPVLFNACGIGRTASTRISDILRGCLRKDIVRLISSRDGADEINLKYFDGNKKAIRTYDPALWTSKVYGIEKNPVDVIGLGVMHCNHIPYSKMVDFWIDMIHYLDNQGIRWKLFCNGELKDYQLGCSVLKKLGFDEKDNILEYAKCPKELVMQIAQFTGIISFRLHSHIIAASLEIPAVALVWDKKVPSFYQTIGYPERCFVIDNSVEDMVKTLFHAMEEGYNQELLETQRQYARTLLIDCIEQVITVE